MSDPSSPTHRSATQTPVLIYWICSLLPEPPLFLFQERERGVYFFLLPDWFLTESGLFSFLWGGCRCRTRADASTNVITVKETGLNLGTKGRWRSFPPPGLSIIFHHCSCQVGALLGNGQTPLNWRRCSASPTQPQDVIWTRIPRVEVTSIHCVFFKLYSPQVHFFQFTCGCKMWNTTSVVSWCPSKWFLNVFLRSLSCPQLSALLSIRVTFTTAVSLPWHPLISN